MEQTEEETKRDISEAIEKAGWERAHVRMEYSLRADRFDIVPKEFKTQKTVQDYKLDYLLLHNGYPVAVVEAKKRGLPDSHGLDQAIKYAKVLEVPFAYSSSGKRFVEYDFNTGRQTELPLNKFPSPDALWKLYCEYKHIDEAGRKIIDSSNLYSDSTGREPRYYQLIAINKVCNAVMVEKKKRLLLVMATGTGKTYTAFQIVWRLRKAGMAKNILYLADRNQLVDQTINGDFSPLRKEMTKIQKGRIDTNYSIFFGLYQQLAGSSDDGSDEDCDKSEIFNYQQVPRDFFDLIIVDECHRGSAREDSLWRDVLTYFESAVQIGLTATPSVKDEANNLEYFGAPVYTYSLKQGIQDGYLAPYQVITIKIKEDVEGWRPQLGEVDDEGRPIPDKLYKIKDFDRTVELTDRIKRVAKVVNDYVQHIGGDPKTIVFCVSQRHALKMRDALRELNPDQMKKSGGKYVVRMTADDEEGKALYDDFTSLYRPYPVIVTTSKLLTTGADTKCVKLIAIDSSIKSMTEFKQIIGRGTRLAPDAGKTFCSILDFREVCDLFKDPGFDGDPPVIHGGGTICIPPGVDGGPVLPAPDSPDDGGEVTGKPAEKKEILTVSGTGSEVVETRIHYLDSEGKLIQDQFEYCIKQNVLKFCSTLEDFLKFWHHSRKSEIDKKLKEHDIPSADLDNLFDPKFYDRFDMICSLVYGTELIARKRRADEAMQELSVLYQDNEQAQEFLKLLINRYAEEDFSCIEDIQSTLSRGVLKPFSSIKQIADLFGGRDGFRKAMSDLEQHIYFDPRNIQD